ncbi:MAG: hypothetical protein H0X24_00910 [Ktedonobacterales bacterium]|nr:hypothetical protein [Ktedonobacterales bacterium]
MNQTTPPQQFYMTGLDALDQWTGGFGTDELACIVMHSRVNMVTIWHELTERVTSFYDVSSLAFGHSLERADANPLALREDLPYIGPYDEVPDEMINTVLVQVNPQRDLDRLAQFLCGLRIEYRLCRRATIVLATLDVQVEEPVPALAVQMTRCERLAPFVETLMLLHRPALFAPLPGNTGAALAGKDALYGQALQVIGLKSRSTPYPSQYQALLHYDLSSGKLSDWPAQRMPVADMNAVIAQRARPEHQRDASVDGGAV